MHRLTLRIEPELYRWIKGQVGPKECFTSAARRILTDAMGQDNPTNSDESLWKVHKKTMAASVYAARLMEKYIGLSHEDGEVMVNEVNESVNAEIKEYSKEVGY